MKEENYHHWLFGDNILTADQSSYLVNLEYGLSIRFNYGDSYFATFEEFQQRLADIQFLNGQRPPKDKVNQLIIEGWNFLCKYEEKQENDLSIEEFDL